MRIALIVVIVVVVVVVVLEVVVRGSRRRGAIPVSGSRGQRHNGGEA